MSRRIKLIYIISKIDKALPFEWVADHMNRELFDISFLLLNPGPSIIEKYLTEKGFPVTNLKLKNKLNYPGLFIRLWRILWIRKPDIIHCHLIDATLLGIISGKLAGIKLRVFTRHHALVHYDEYYSGRKWDILCNYLATDIIAISKNVEDILIRRDKASPGKISLIYHGFDIQYFQSSDKVAINLLRKKYGIPEGKFPVIGVIARYLQWKGIQCIIPAFNALLEKYQQAHLIIANTTGNFSKSLKSLLSELPDSSYTEISFEENLATLYHLFDLFIHVPVNKEVEAFGQVYVESLLSGVPSIFTLSGIACEFIKNRENALVVDYENSGEIYRAMDLLLTNADLRSQLIRNGKESAARFAIENHIESLENLYLK